MSLPASTRAYRRTEDGKSIELVTEALPKTLGPNEVLLKIHAVSLNFRDIAMISGRYPVEVIDKGVPCSDAAATVVAAGSSVTSFKKDDYVTPSFQLGVVTGQEKHVKAAALGGDADGVLREYAVYEQQYLTKVPQYLSYEEGSTIACAGVTAWTALDMDKKNSVDAALMQGTGGVSLFATLICLAAGITPIVTSSSDEKLEQVKALGTKEHPVLGINYSKTPNWAEEARKLTKDAGVDVVVNNVGITAMNQSFEALCTRSGTISLVGFLGGMPENMPDVVMPTMKKGAKVQ